MEIAQLLDALSMASSHDVNCFQHAEPGDQGSPGPLEFHKIISEVIGQCGFLASHLLS